MSTSAGLLNCRRVSRALRHVLDTHRPTWARVQAQPRLKFGVDTGLTTLHLAAWHGMADLCQKLVNATNGRCNDVADSDGVTPLHSAALNGVGDNLEAMRVLLQS